ncbi:HNH endonuclease signature motif containing protein [Thermomonas sp.]|uniref:HNH endonuclease signature motif containing protein n=1 Tax=Thermomonas sp. TaxID=1971895 RepID=UPI0035B4AABB
MTLQNEPGKGSPLESPLACRVDTRLAPGVGLSRPISLPAGIFVHVVDRLAVDTETGTIYGHSGAKVGHADRRGYVRIWISRRDYRYAHRIVAEACHGQIPAGHQVDHLNGIKSDNRPTNLEIVTPLENTSRAIRNGQTPVGSRCVKAKLTEADVIEIRGSHEPGSVLAKRFGVCKETANKARRGAVWKHVDAPPRITRPGRRAAN